MNQITLICGFLTGLFVVFRIVSKGGPSAESVAKGLVGFFAGSNIPVAIFLCYYIFDPEPSKLIGLEKYIGFAGLSILYLSAYAIWLMVNGRSEDSIETKPSQCPNEPTASKEPPERPI